MNNILTNILNRSKRLVSGQSPEPLASSELSVISGQELKLNRFVSVVPENVDVGEWFDSLPKDITSVMFMPGVKYKSKGDINLPEKRLFIVDGNGCELNLGPTSNGFTYEVKNMQDAMRRTNSRYIIKNFAAITNGMRGMALKGSLNSVIDNIQFISQTVAAIDLRFALMTRISNILVTNPRKDGIVLREGDWPGANWANSQSNHTVMDQCRVFCMTTTEKAFTVLNSNGVTMTNCVAEGTQCDYDLFLSAAINGDESNYAKNTVVKSFTLSNFHVEHKTKKASIYINMPSQSTVNLSNIYWNAGQSAPIILYTMGQVNISDIGWWPKSFWIASRISAPRINISKVPNSFTLDANSVRLYQPIGTSTDIKTPYVRVSQLSV